MDVDIILEPNLTPVEIAELGQVAESYGARAIWHADYFAHWDPFVALTTLANQTSKIRMGILAIAPFEMHPLKIANQLLSLNEICDGRAMVSIGAGEGNNDAMALDTPKKIVLAVREAIEIVRASAHGGLKDGFDGEIFNVNHPCAYDWLSCEPPLVYGAAYRYMMMRMQGRVADGCFIGCTPPEVVGPAVENIQVGLSRRDTPCENFRIGTYWAWHIKEDREAAFRESRHELPWRARKLDPELTALFLTPDEVDIVTRNFDNYVDAYFKNVDEVENVSKEISNKLATGFTSTGGLDDLGREIERFKLFAQAGLSEISFKLHDDPMDALHIIGKQVIPALRDY
ncbi:MAG: LLM class flavin-dependent oxidoreductase [Gammaproteobacteria bacterium]